MSYLLLKPRNALVNSHSILERARERVYTGRPLKNVKTTRLVLTCTQQRCWTKLRRYYSKNRLTERTCVEIVNFSRRFPRIKRYWTYRSNTICTPFSEGALFEEFFPSCLWFVAGSMWCFRFQGHSYFIYSLPLMTGSKVHYTSLCHTRVLSLGRERSVARWIFGRTVLIKINKTNRRESIFYFRSYLRDKHNRNLVPSGKAGCFGSFVRVTPEMSLFTSHGVYGQLPAHQDRVFWYIRTRWKYIVCGQYF